MVMCVAAGGEKAATGHIAPQLCRNHSLRRASASVIVVPQQQSLSQLCHNTKLQFLVSAASTMTRAWSASSSSSPSAPASPGPATVEVVRGGNKIIVYDIPVSVNTNMSTSLPTIYPSYLYLNSQENKVNAKRDIMRILFYSHDISPFLWCDVILFCHLTTRPNTMQHFCNGLSN